MGRYSAFRAAGNSWILEPRSDPELGLLSFIYLFLWSFTCSPNVWVSSGFSGLLPCLTFQSKRDYDLVD